MSGCRRLRQVVASRGLALTLPECGCYLRLLAANSGGRSEPGREEESIRGSSATGSHPARTSHAFLPGRIGSVVPGSGANRCFLLVLHFAECAGPCKFSSSPTLPRETSAGSHAGEG